MVAPHTIKEHMEVVGSDGVHVGTVDHMEGADEMKLTANDEDAGGEHHFIPLAWVDHVDGKCTSNSQAPRPRRAGKRTRIIGRLIFAAVRPTARRRIYFAVNPGRVSSVS